MFEKPRWGVNGVWSMNVQHNNDAQLPHLLLPTNGLLKDQLKKKLQKNPSAVICHWKIQADCEGWLFSPSCWSKESTQHSEMKRFTTKWQFWFHWMWHFIIPAEWMKNPSFWSIRRINWPESSVCTDDAFMLHCFHSYFTFCLFKVWFMFYLRSTYIIPACIFPFFVTLAASALGSWRQITRTLCVELLQSSRTLSWQVRTVLNDLSVSSSITGQVPPARWPTLSPWQH